MDQPVVLNEELPKKYESYSGKPDNKVNTLDEPVIQTIVTHSLTQKRDVLEIYTKVTTTLTGANNY